MEGVHGTDYGSSALERASVGGSRRFTEPIEDGLTGSMSAHPRNQPGDADRSDSTGRPRTHALGRRPARRTGRGAGGGSGLFLRLTLALVLAWAIAATWLAVSGRSTAARLQDEQEELRLAYDDKIKALTRRLVGVASHQILEQDGLSGRLADIIARQVELENRQSALALMGDKAAGTTASSPAQPARSRQDDEQAPRTRIGPAEPPKVELPARTSPTLRLGAPAPAELAPASPGPRSSLEDRSVLPPPGNGSRALQGIQALPLREQFTRLEASLNRLDGAQVRYLGSLSASAQTGVALIRASLATLGLSIQPETGPAAKGRSPTARAAALNRFEAQLASVQTDLSEFERWRSLADVVPVRSPFDGDSMPTSNFGSRKDPFTGAVATHAGMDFRGAVGTPIKAAAAGRVITADVSGGYGNLVEVEHGNGIVTRYAHLSGFNVSTGQSVTPGMVVGLLGSTGRSTGPHLHYETRINGSAVDPARFLQAGAQLFDHPPPVAVPGAAAEEEASFD